VCENLHENTRLYSTHLFTKVDVFPPFQASAEGNEIVLHLKFKMKLTAMCQFGWNSPEFKQGPLILNYITGGQRPPPPALVVAPRSTIPPCPCPFKIKLESKIEFGREV
jgi:hypothetical protein